MGVIVSDQFFDAVIGAVVSTIYHLMRRGLPLSIESDVVVNYHLLSYLVGGAAAIAAGIPTNER